MTLTKLGLYIEQSDARNGDGQYGEDAVVGLSTQKQMIRTKADLSGVNLSSYKLMAPRAFAYVPDTSRRGDKVSLAFNSTEDTYLVSSISVVFSVKQNCVLLPDYLFMYFNRPEFDRYARFNSWGSARETFSWEDMCDIDIELPPIEIQQKYVDIYNAMLANQKSYGRGLEDLKLVCDGYIENLRRKFPSRPIKTYIMQKNDRNSDKAIERVMGLSTKKEFREAQSRVNREKLGNYKIVKPQEIAFVPTTDTWKVLAFAVNTFKEDIVVSPVYEVFSVDSRILIPEYLAMWLTRKEFDRYARYHSWGSARENFSFEDMCDIEIPIPDIKTQQYIINIFNVYQLRKEISKQLLAQIKDLCPILIRGSIDEASAC